MTKQLILEYLNRHKSEYKEKFGVEKIGLFGSYARDEANENSDIDLVIEMNPKSLKKRLMLKKRLENDLQSSIDIGYLSSLRNFVANEIKKEIIYV